MRFLLLLALTACSSFQVQNPYTHTEKFAPIVRLSAVMFDGQEHFFCSGTVISDKYIVTAAHCVAGASAETPIIISTVSGVKITTAHVEGYGQQLDLAILSGSFKQFEHVAVETDSARIQRSFEHSSEVQSCGYPSGGALVCKSFSHATPYVFMYSAPGVSMYPGMSGGPVIDMETGKLIGVNTAMTEHEALLSPTIELFVTLNVQE